MYDRPFYEGLSRNEVCIIEGKMATTIGPVLIDGEQRPVYSLELTCPLILSALRLMRREGKDLTSLEELKTYFAQIEDRREHLKNLRERVTDKPQRKVEKINIDTSINSPYEAANLLVGETSQIFMQHESEIDGIKKIVDLLPLYWNSQLISYDTFQFFSIASQALSKEHRDVVANLFQARRKQMNLNLEVILPDTEPLAKLIEISLFDLLPSRYK